MLIKPSAPSQLGSGGLAMQCHKPANARAFSQSGVIWLISALEVYSEHIKMRPTGELGESARGAWLVLKKFRKRCRTKAALHLTWSFAENGLSFSHQFLLSATTILLFPNSSKHQPSEYIWTARYYMRISCDWNYESCLVLEFLLEARLFLLCQSHRL